MGAALSVSTSAQPALALRRCSMHATRLVKGESEALCSATDTQTKCRAVRCGMHARGMAGGRYAAAARPCLTQQEQGDRSPEAHL